MKNIYIASFVFIVMSFVFMPAQKAMAGIPTFTADRTALNTIVLTFNEAVTGTAIADSFTVAGASSVTNTAPVASTTVTLTTVGLTATNGTPNVGYVAATGDIASVSTSDEIANGGAIAAVDHVAPTVTSVSPANTSRGNDRMNPIVINFSEPMTKGTFVFSTTPAFTYTATWSNGDATVSLAHNTFSSNQLHTASITTATDASAALNAVAALPYSWTFVTTLGSTSTTTDAPVLVKNASMSINSGATTTNSQDVVLTLGATDATSMVVSNNPFFSNAGWEAYAPTKNWALTSGNGSKTVYVKFMSSSGVESSVVSGTITLDQAFVAPTTAVTTPTITITPVSVPAETTTVVAPGCSGGNKYNTSTGALCVNTVVKVYNLGTKTLKNGSAGDAVMELQRFLNDKLNLGLVVDGKLGPKTIAIIKKWQKENGLVADGLVGAKTKALMNK